MPYDKYVGSVGKYIYKFDLKLSVTAGMVRFGVIKYSFEGGVAPH